MEDEELKVFLQGLKHRVNGILEDIERLEDQLKK